MGVDPLDHAAVHLMLYGGDIDIVAEAFLLLATFGVALATGDITAAELDLSGYKLKGISTPNESPPFNVEIDFATGEAVWSKDDGAKSTRQVGKWSASNGSMSLNLAAKSPVGILDLICTGTYSGMQVELTCNANAGMEWEKLVGTLQKAS